jgi:diguanylate cyclase
LSQSAPGDEIVISLKKYLDMDPKHLASDAVTSELLLATLASYRAALEAIGKSGAQACPGVGSDLQQALAGLAPRLSGQLTPALVVETEAQVEEVLKKWGGRSEDYFKAKAKEVKELLIVLAHTAQSLGERDQRYSSQFSEFTTRLRTIANLDDLTQIRNSVMQGASELKNYVDRMAEDSQKSVAQLRAEISTYESRLRVVEELALRDALTGLANRRNLEERINTKITNREAFCVLSLDLNGLKQVNDSHGHLAGDDLLKQFSNELRSNIGSSGIAGRWGGDEFIVVMDCNLANANAQVERIKKWVFGDYTLQPGGGKREIKVFVEASIGVAQWHVGQTMQQLVENADEAMYAEKQASKKRRAVVAR